MTSDERIEALLNRAGQTISDLPRKWDGCVSEPYSGEQCYKAHGAAWAWYVGEDQRAVPELERQESTRDRLVLRSYILHLTDVIDRMETALENVIGERDWLKSVLERHLFCETCVGGQGMEPCVDGHRCSIENPNYRYSGVPEDWGADDD